MMAMAHRGSVKLFGKMIQVEDNPHPHTDEGGGGGAAAAGHGDFGKEQETLLNQKSTIKPQVQAREHTTSEENPSEPDNIGDKEAILSVKSSVQKEEEEEEDEQEEENSLRQSDSQVKTLLKKPDKILPCPRCNSQDTKFCYFNNYNVNQPRHFCRNCQRYWTAGGTMRNVPVGAGRRKNKSASSCHYQSITLSELGSLQAVQSSIPELAYHSNGTVLSFGSNGPSCESTVLEKNDADKNTMNCCRNGEADESSNGSSVTGSNSAEEGGGASLKGQGLQNSQPQASYFSVPTWASTWNQASISIPFYHVNPYWGCSMPNPQNNPWISHQNAGVPKPSEKSSQLGKHSRDGNIVRQSGNADKVGDNSKQGAQERHLSVPETLTIDDPEEAAKSSVWLTMDLKKHKSDWISRGGLFKTFQPKALMESQLVQNSSEVFQPNPAAWSRSVSFRESQ